MVFESLANSITGVDKYVEFVQGDVVGFTRNLQHQHGQNIWLVGGSGLLDQFLKENLVDEFIVTFAPILLGKGIHLFKKDIPEIMLSLNGSRRFGEFVQLQLQRLHILHYPF